MTACPNSPLKGVPRNRYGPDSVWCRPWGFGSLGHGEPPNQLTPDPKAALAKEPERHLAELNKLIQTDVAAHNKDAFAPGAPTLYAGEGSLPSVTKKHKWQEGGSANMHGLTLAETMGRLRRSASLFYRTFNPSRQELRTRPWFKVDGDRTLKYDYDVKRDDLVFDLGGYDGQWSSNIFSRFCCSIHIFEPVKRFAEGIAAWFQHNPNVTVHAFGLAGSTRTESIMVDGMASSYFIKRGVPEETRLVRAGDFLADNGIDKIRLMKVNIEGGEYELLEHLIETGHIRNIADLLVQFHDFVPDAPARMRKIQEALSRTHYPTFQYEFVFENWRLRTG
jgi:FkbM family methyltransferase